MTLSDQELWQILQVEPVAPPMPWEQDVRLPVGQAWLQWAKAEVLSGGESVLPAAGSVDWGIVYLVRLLRVLDVLAESGIAPPWRRLEGGGALYEDSYVRALLENGWAACGSASGCSAASILHAKLGGFLAAHEFDDWRPGMRSGSGWRTYYELTFKGKKRAEQASTMPPVYDEQVEEPLQDHEAQSEPAANTAAPSHRPPAGRAVRPPAAAVRAAGLPEGVPSAQSGTMERFVAGRQEPRRVINYDQVLKAHKCEQEGTATERDTYHWTFLLGGEPQLILSLTPENDESRGKRALKRDYFKTSCPCGYSIVTAGDDAEGVVVFPKGEAMAFGPHSGARVYPDELFKAGDYELQKVREPGTSIDTMSADVRETREIAIRLPGAIAKIEKGVETVQQHVRSVPILQAELAEARVAPEALALEIQNRIADILTVEEQAIWRAVRNAGGSQKEALPALRAARIVKSAATLSRRVKEIDAKLLKNNLPRCSAAGPTTRYAKSGGYVNADGKTVAVELSAVEHDWAEDALERDTTIQAYLKAGPEDKRYFLQKKPGIEDEAAKYLKRHPLKSG